MSSEPAKEVDLDAYRARIGYRGPLAPTLEVLEHIHLAHATHIPFEALDVLLGKPILLDLDSLQAKLVRGNRGGYCYEQNALLGAVLDQIGFRLTRLAGRVRLGATQVRPRTHMLLEVEVDGKSWIADVGFGAEGLLKPVPLGPGEEVDHFGRTYRVAQEPDTLVMQSLHGDGWEALYSFTREPQLAVDYEMANYFTSTHPTSRFLNMVAVGLPTPEVRYTLRGHEFTILRGNQVEVRTVTTEKELFEILAEIFGLAFPPDTHFRVFNESCELAKG
jgi:N-hydroxyarylamine O-acetyltransferase